MSLDNTKLLDFLGEIDKELSRVLLQNRLMLKNAL